MPVSIQEEFLKRNPSKRLNIGVAIDGSSISDQALTTACGIYDGRRGDRLFLLHVADPAKNYLPRNLEPKHLESTYVDKAYTCSRVRAEWACRNKGTASTCEALMMLAKELKVDLLVVGSFGRKGERVDMLGTVSDYSLRQGHSSVTIVRSSAPKAAAGSHQYMFATDGSKAAALAFCTLCHQIMKPGDSVLLVSCGYDTEGATELFQPYKELAARLNVPCDVLMHQLQRNQTVADGLLQLVTLKDVDTLVCGISGYSQKKLGSVSDELTHRATCNTIVIKDPYEVNQYLGAGAVRRSTVEVHHHL